MHAGAIRGKGALLVDISEGLQVRLALGLFFEGQIVR